LSNYTQSTDFSAKDALASGDPNKKTLGAEVDGELALIATAITSKQDEVSSLTAGTVVAEATDYLLMYDTSAADGRKVIVGRFADELTAANTTTGATTVSFTSIPSYVRRMTLIVRALSLTGTDSFGIQIGDSGGFETASYQSQIYQLGAALLSATSTAGITCVTDNANSYTWNGIIEAYLLESSTNTWVFSGRLQNTAGTMHSMFSGYKATSATMDRIRFISDAANTFDAVNVALRYGP
jgi:hypothetical protein